MGTLLNLLIDCKQSSKRFPKVAYHEIRVATDTITSGGDNSQEISLVGPVAFTRSQFTKLAGITQEAVRARNQTGKPRTDNRMRGRANNRCPASVRLPCFGLLEDGALLLRD
jgi:hypothetical protein